MTTIENGLVPQYSCDLCSFQTTTPQGLGRHKQGTHGIPGQRRPKAKTPPTPAPESAPELPIHPPAPVHPPLGATLHLTALALDEDGNVLATLHHAELDETWEAVFLG